MTEIIYVLINEAMPGYVKIGMTANLEQRIRSLDTTSVPLPFECFYAARVQDAKFVERKLHDAFGDHRVRSNREFFEIAPERVVAALQLAALEEVTPAQDYVETLEDRHALEKAKQRRSAFNFSLVDVKPGSVLSFTRDPDITCIVIDNKNIQFEGRATSLSSAAVEIMTRMGNTARQLQGPQYWEYEGETLLERRQRLEEAA